MALSAASTLLVSGAATASRPRSRVAPVAGALPSAGRAAGACALFAPRAAQPPPRRAPRPAHRARLPPPRSNELNKWSHQDGGDGEGDEYEDDYSEGFDKETMALFTKTLTARAAQKMLIELSDTDEVAALWLNNFIADASNKPIAGDAFIGELLAARPAVMEEPGCTLGPAEAAREVSPPQMAQRLLTARKAMAARIAKRNFATHVEGANMQVLRAHLTRSTYVSGK